MKSIRLAVLLSLAAYPACAGQGMSPAPTPMPAQLQPGADTEAARRGAKLHAELLALRDEGLKLREADGGTLTPKHRAYLQKKLDRLNAQARALN